MSSSSAKALTSSTQGVLSSKNQFDAASDSSVASTANHDDSSQVCSATSTRVTSRTNTTTSNEFLRSSRRISGSTSLDSKPLEASMPLMYDDIYRQDLDIVGQYLQWRAGAHSFYVPNNHCALRSDDHKDYSREHAEHDDPAYSPGSSYDSCPYVNAPYFEEVSPAASFAAVLRPQQFYPNPENIRHLHTLHSLLPYIQPDRKLNALNGLELDIVDGGTTKVLCRAVSKKLLVMFLGRKVVRKFLHTFQRESNESWTGAPIQQGLVLPSGITSHAAMKILVSWMIRACKYTTMDFMEPMRIPDNTFAACSLAQTLELFGLHKDAYRVDSAISKHHFQRPIYMVEVETLWNCLGENNRYVYSIVLAFHKQLGQEHGEGIQLQDLATRHPKLHARIINLKLNEQYKPVFGRQWFAKVGLRGGHDEDPPAAASKAEGSNVRSPLIVHTPVTYHGPVPQTRSVVTPASGTLDHNAHNTATHPPSGFSAPDNQTLRMNRNALGDVQQDREWGEPSTTSNGGDVDQDPGQREHRAQVAAQLKNLNNVLSRGGIPSQNMSSIMYGPPAPMPQSGLPSAV